MLVVALKFVGGFYVAVYAPNGLDSSFVSALDAVCAEF